ncbi:hypothetical protein RKD38_001643 [Streptomyces ambofaciens]
MKSSAVQTSVSTGPGQRPLPLTGRRPGTRAWQVIGSRSEGNRSGQDTAEPRTGNGWTAGGAGQDRLEVAVVSHAVACRGEALRRASRPPPPLEHRGCDALTTAGPTMVGGLAELKYVRWVKARPLRTPPGGTTGHPCTPEPNRASKTETLSARRRNGPGPTGSDLVVQAGCRKALSGLRRARSHRNGAMAGMDMPRRNDVTVVGQGDGVALLLPRDFECDQNMWRLAVPASRSGTAWCCSTTSAPTDRTCRPGAASGTRPWRVTPATQRRSARHSTWNGPCSSGTRSAPWPGRWRHAPAEPLPTPHQDRAVWPGRAARGHPAYRLACPSRAQCINPPADRARPVAWRATSSVMSAIANLAPPRTALEDQTA